LSDTITILKCAPGLRLAKLIKADGSIEPYNQTRHFDIAEVKLSGLDRLAEILRYLLPRPDLCVVRGAVADPDRTRHVRRLLYPDIETGDSPTIRDTDHFWIGLDVEGVARPDDVDAADLAACARLAIGLLPGEFHDARCLIQASASHALKAGCRLRLWFWASRPVSGSELGYWMRRSPVDNCLFRPAQITYTAAPIFQTGVDHLPCRLAEIPGDATVEVPAPADLRPPAAADRPATARVRPSDTSAERIIARSLFKVATAGMGEKHYSLRAAARTIGGLIDQAGISRSEATAALMDAVRRAGGADIDDRNASATIAWGLTIGAQSPLRLEERRT
jgi:hypothetical protein